MTNSAESPALDDEPAHEHTWLFGVCIGNDCNVKEREAEDG